MCATRNRGVTKTRGSHGSLASHVKLCQLVAYGDRSALVRRVINTMQRKRR